MREADHRFFLPVFKRFPLDVHHGKGVYLYDKNGNAYLDFLAGIAVNALGYQHPAVNDAIRRQMDRNLHLSNFFLQDIQVALVEHLLTLTPFSKIFLTNSGTEAVEGLLKLVKKWGGRHNKDEIIAFEGSFHGRSLGALSITMQDKYQQNFHPLMPHIKRVPFNDMDSFRSTINERTAAVFYEGITGEGGLRPVSKAMINAIYEGRERFGYLAIADEIQTGVGRTGKFYYYEHDNVAPDAIASAKGLGGGLPLGAFMVKAPLTDVFDLGEHGTTYGGNPLACATGLATIKYVSQPDFLKSVFEKGQYFQSLLHQLKDEYSDFIVDIRGCGLMIGLEVRHSAKELMQSAFDNGIIFNLAGATTLRFVPPLIVEIQHIDEAYDLLRRSIDRVLNK